MRQDARQGKAPGSHNLHLQKEPTTSVSFEKVATCHSFNKPAYNARTTHHKTPQWLF
jgi:hypothetical protein